MQFAKDCRVRYDFPNVLAVAPDQLNAEMASQVGLTEIQRLAVNKLLVKVHSDFNQLLRELYIEVTGDVKKSEELSPQALASDLQEKSPAGESTRARQKIANERAGLAEPPTSLEGTSAIERYFRALAGLGGKTEEPPPQLRSVAAHGSPETDAISIRNALLSSGLF